MIKSLTAALLLASLALPAFASKLDDAIADYNSKQYGQAITKLGDVLRAKPNDSKAHYYLALAYQGASQIKAAQTQYYWVYQNSTDDRLKYQAWQALSQMKNWTQHRAYNGNNNNAVAQVKPAAQPISRGKRPRTSIIEDQSQMTGPTVIRTAGCH